MEFIRKHKHFRCVCRLNGLRKSVTLFELMFPAHSKRQSCNFLEIPLSCHKCGDGIIGNFFNHRFVGDLVGIKQFRFSRFAFFFRYLRQLLNDYLFHSCGFCENIFDIRYVSRKFFKFGSLIQNVFLIKITQFYIRNKFRLRFIYTESYHKIRHYFIVVFGLTNYLYRLIYVEKYLLKSRKQMVSVFLLCQVKKQSAFYTFRSERYPFGQYFANTHNTGRTRYKNIEVT